MNLCESAVPALPQVLKYRALVHDGPVAVLVQYLEFAHDLHCHRLLRKFVMGFPHPAEATSANTGQHDEVRRLR